MVIKVIGAVLTISSMSAMGFYFSTILRIRLDELKELKKYMFVLKGGIRYGGTPLPEALEGIANRNNGSFQTFFQSIATNLKSLQGGTFMEIWTQAITRDLKDTSITKVDKEQLRKVGECLGYLDKEMQMNTIDLYLSQLEGQIEELSKEIKERTRLYNLLGVMAGIFVTIVMI